MCTKAVRNLFSKTECGTESFNKKVKFQERNVSDAVQNGGSESFCEHKLFHRMLSIVTIPLFLFSER